MSRLDVPENAFSFLQVIKIKLLNILLLLAIDGIKIKLLNILVL